jgi:PAS domain S-box-containing protein
MAIQEDKARLEALFASVGEGIITTDDKARITRANQVALNILGYKRGELVGIWFTDAIVAVHEDGSMTETMDRPITRAFVTGTTIRATTHYLTKNGAVIPVSITVSPILLHGRPVGAVEIFRDISQELRTDRMKTNFISLASHQLRTPLTAIRLYSQMIYDGLGGDLNDQQRAFLDTIIAATGTMNDLINTLLNITRIESGTIAVNAAPTKLDEMVQQIFQQFVPEARDKGIRIHERLPKGPCEVTTDPVLVREVFTNLISNAVKYTPKGGSVLVSLKNTAREFVFSVHDTGYGIPAEDQQYIFTKFFRAENVTKREESGSGLGLYLIKMLAENLGGDVWFESIENKGSTFYFSLPTNGSLTRSGRFRME